MCQLSTNGAMDSGIIQQVFGHIQQFWAKHGEAILESASIRNSIIASVRREKLMLWTWGSNLPYARRQEYEHVARKGFIRKAVWEHRQDYRDAIERRVKEFGK